MGRKAVLGFTLVELMIVIVIAAIILAAAVPSFRNILWRNRVATQTNELVTSLNLARSEAIKRGVRVTLCKSANADAANAVCTGGGGWDQGWLVFVDSDRNGQVDAGELLLKAHPGLPAGFSLVGSNGVESGLTYMAGGYLGGPVVGNGNFRVCPPEPYPVNGNDVQVNLTGRVRLVADVACP